MLVKRDCQTDDSAVQGMDRASFGADPLPTTHTPLSFFRGKLFTATRAFKSFLIPLSCHSWMSCRRLLKVTVRLTSKEATRYRWNLPLSSQCHPGLTTLGGSVGQRGRGRCAFEPRLEYSAFSQGVTRLTPTALGRPVPS